MCPFSSRCVADETGAIQTWAFLQVMKEEGNPSYAQVSFRMRSNDVGWAVLMCIDIADDAEAAGREQVYADSAAELWFGH
jgi:hypothetical protein